MGFDAFDKSEMDPYKQEAKARWGSTDAYQEYAQRSRRGKIPGDAGTDMMALFAQLGALRHLSPKDCAVQDKIAGLQAFISENCYTCSKEILSGLGQMYTSDERFTRSIDAAGGEGTALFASKAIEIFCR